MNPEKDVKREKKIQQLKMRVTPIGNGTALDHIPSGHGLRIIEILGFEKDKGAALAINTESRKMGRKDLVLLEDRFLSEKELEKVKLLARNATHNVIENYKVAKKETLGLPEKVEDIIKCINPNCITNHEAIPTKFIITKKEPLEATCYYCETAMEEEEIMKAIK